jgi:ElaB/YqjD/DUF883 family membrane-anchored ribosome-binding protein
VGHSFNIQTGAIEMTTRHKNKLMEDLQLVIEDAEELLRMTAKEAGDSAADVRKRVQERMEQAKVELLHVQDAAIAQAKAAGQAADAFVHENPWKSVGVAAGLGLVLGLLLSRR